MGSHLYMRPAETAVLIIGACIFSAKMACSTDAHTTTDLERNVETAHSLTGRGCAATRHHETIRQDSLFKDPYAYKLAGREGRANPMGEWIMVPRTVFGDQFITRHYERGTRQVVLLGAGMDARAYRMSHLNESVFFEVDQATTFDVKEPLLHDDIPTVKARHTVTVELDSDSYNLKAELLKQGFSTAEPTVWVLEGLVMYLSMKHTRKLMQDIGELSARGSAVFHDAISASYLDAGVVVMGAPFIGGSDEYAGLWATDAGFTAGTVYNFEEFVVDRKARALKSRLGVPRPTPQSLRGRRVVLFVEAGMPA